MGGRRGRGVRAAPTARGDRAPVTGAPTRVETIDPILRVEDMGRSVRYYVDVLGFREADWGTDDFTYVGLDGRGLYLCRGAQGRGGAWVWVGVDDVRELHRIYRERGAIIRGEPVNRPWALEMQVEDPDGNVLRFGSEPETDARTGGS
jgi:catechol 2,3-dioxygenase-like lactoylglutathione lyase family enzyme